MLKFVGLFGGLCGLIVSVLVTWGYPDDVGGLNLIIYSDDEVYRYNVETGKLNFLRQQPAWSEFTNLIDVSERSSPNGQWTAITYSANPDKVYVIDNLSGSLERTIEVSFDDSNNYFGRWSPDSRRIGWITFVSRQSQTYVQTLDVLSGKVRQFPLPSEFLPAGRWRDEHTVEIWSASQFGSYIIDILSGKMTYEDHVSPDTVNSCCAYAYASEAGLHIYEQSQHTFVFSTDALEAQASQDLRSIAYLQADSDVTAHVFTYDTVTGENKQITGQSIFVGEECVQRTLECEVLGEWSPNGKWLVLLEGATLKILDMNTGQTQTILERFGTTVWSYNAFTQARQTVGWWIVSSLAVLLVGLWRMVA